MIKSFQILKAFRYLGEYGTLIDIERHISDVIETLESAGDIIRKNGYDPIKYEYLYREASENSKYIQNAIIAKLKPDYEAVAITEELFAEYLLFEESKGRYLTYEAMEFDAIDDDLREDVKAWIAVKNSEYYEAYYKLQDYVIVLSGKYMAYEHYKSLEAEILNYKPTKESKLEMYFICDNIEALKHILREANGKQGKEVAKMLIALERAGCTMCGDFQPLFEKILDPIYRVQGSRQAVIKQLKILKGITDITDPATAKQLRDMTERYKKILQ